MPLDDNDRKLVADLYRHPGLTILRRWLIEERDRYFTEIAKDLYKPRKGEPETVTPLTLAYDRGYYRGCFRLINEPVFQHRTFRPPEDKEGDEP